MSAKKKRGSGGDEPDEGGMMFREEAKEEQHAEAEENVVEEGAEQSGPLPIARLEVCIIWRCVKTDPEAQFRDEMVLGKRVEKNKN